MKILITLSTFLVTFSNITAFPQDSIMKRSVNTEVACGSEITSGFELTTQNAPYLVQSPNYDGTTLYDDAG
jgi:hypothetical protein